MNTKGLERSIVRLNHRVEALESKASEQLPNPCDRCSASKARPDFLPRYTITETT